ncbi:apolipoprotein L3-like [Acipenser ruthenus]|uniref:apolipoprotein L3-like n=1 Tax=Acipenser ruthenus TaxID=7906 RepID=UPI00274234D9|nr:apolipoprotein L3-like [Acipenser ruthenus]
MDTTTRRRRNSIEEPPYLSEDHDREKIEEFSRDFKRIEEFVRLFEEEKWVIEGLLRELSGIADGLDEAHRKAAIAKTTGSCVSAVGGIMTITGLVLAPFTFGASTVLAAAGVGAAVAGGATNVTTEIVQACSDRDDNKRVEEILGIIQSKMSALGESVNKACLTLSKWDEYHIEEVRLILKAGRQFGSACRAVGNIASMVKTFKILRANPALKALAKQVTAVSSSAAKGIKGVNALKGVVSKAAPVGLSKGARIAGGVVAGVFVAWDVYDIAKNSIDIHKGCKTERAQEIRELVENVKGVLKKLEGVSSDMKGGM